MILLLKTLNIILKARLLSDSISKEKSHYLCTKLSPLVASWFLNYMDIFKVAYFKDML